VRFQSSARLEQRGIRRCRFGHTQSITSDDDEPPKRFGMDVTKQ
jgi:hypothetical protein